MAKENWMAEQCREIEGLQQIHDTFNLHKKIKECAGIQRNKTYGLLVDKNNSIVIGIAEKLKTWTEYIEKLFTDNRPAQHGLLDDDTGADILKYEVRHAIRLAKNGKAPGPDGVYTELLKLAD